MLADQIAKEVVAYTDGACSGNPGPGGWGAVLSFNGETRELSGGEAETTNNRMELMAAISALEALKRHSSIKIVTDSKYVMDGATSWLKGWKARGWKTADGKPVKNQDLWMRLDSAITAHKVRWEWVRGHTGHEGNERADALARNAISAVKP